MMDKERAEQKRNELVCTTLAVLREHLSAPGAPNIEADLAANAERLVDMLVQVTPPEMSGEVGFVRVDS
jgi:hypothetical protein